MKLTIIRKLVCALEACCFLFHWIPGWRCRLADWSLWLDEKYGTGEWRIVEDGQAQGFEEIISVPPR